MKIKLYVNARENLAILISQICENKNQKTFFKLL